MDGQGRADRLVSVVVTNFNYARYVGEAVSSAATQTYPSVEVIVVDDASTDLSSDVLGQLAEEHDLTIIRRPTNGGQAAAMNDGFAASRGSYVMFLDGDDVLDRNAVQSLLTALEDDAATAQFFLRTIDSGGSPLGLHPFCNILEQGDVFRQICASGHFRFMPTSGNLFRRDVLAHIFPIPEREWRICADTYLIFAAAALARVQTVRQVLGSYRIHDRNAWFRHIEGPDQLRQIKRNHLTVWIQMLDLVPSVEGRGYDGYTLLGIVRRIAITLFELDDDVIAASELREMRRRMIRLILALTIDPGERLLHLAIVLLCRSKRGRLDRVFRALAVPAFRSRGPLRILRRLESPRRHQWLAAAPFPRKIETLPIGVKLDFGHGGPAQRFHWYGFGETENWRSWASAERAGLVFRVPPEAPELWLSLDLAPYTHGEVLPAQRIVISAGATVLYSGTLAKRSEIAFALPTSARTVDGVLVLEFEFPDAVVPELVDASSSASRVTSVALVTLKAELPKGATLPPFPVIDREEEIRDGHSKLEHFFCRGWKVLENTICLTKTAGTIRFTLPEPAMRRVAIVLEFATTPAVAPGDCRLKVEWPDVGSDEIDLRRVGTAVVIAPRSKVGAAGAIALNVTCGAVRLHPLTGLPGPHLRRLYVRDFDRVGDTVAVFRPGEIVSFGPGGHGSAFLLDGWHESGATGTWVTDTTASLGGYFFNLADEIFLTVRITASTEGAERQNQRVRLLANGVEIANYFVAGTLDLIAVAPASVLRDGCYLRLELRCECASRMPSPVADGGLGLCLHHVLIETATEPARRRRPPALSDERDALTETAV